MQTSEQINELAAALSGAQSEMEHATKDRMNPAFKSRYADLASIVDACRAPLTRHGLCVLQAPSVEGNAVSVETRLVHKSGQWVSTTISCTVPDGKATTIGSAVTYLRRYSLAAMTSIAPDDDDGNAATRAPQPPTMTVQSALDLVIGKHPHLRDEASAIVAQNRSARETIDALRELYKQAPGAPA